MAADVMVKEYADYGQFVDMMQAAGWIRKQKNIDENTTSIVQTFSTAANVTEAKVIEITCPAGYIITTKGVEQIPAGADRGSAHAMTLRLAGTDNTQINRDVKVKMEIIKPFEDTKLITRDFYSMYSITKQLGVAGISTDLDKGDNEIYRWRRGFALYTQEVFRISVLNPNIAVDKDHVTMQMDLDFWYKQV
jgi:hypothetical protein